MSSPRPAPRRLVAPLIGATLALLPASFAAARPAGPTTRPADEERLSFQTSEGYQSRVRLNADVAMVYGIDKTLPDRIKTWRDAGYKIHVMTGVSWGEYQDYYFGQWDGQNHEDEIQTESNGKKIGHGGTVFYMAPGEKYGEYLCEGVKRALDAGAEAVHLEEPEIWVRAGWEEGFKREWQAYYHEPWVAPDSSADAQYRASKLKYYLYRRTLAQVFAFVKKYGDEHGRKIACYVPTHSLINYASWGIVSPESSLLDVGCDGYIAQVWTGTARTPNFYDGVEAQRTFETAFLEYGAMQNLVRASGRRVWYLNDPIEDNANHSWFDYRTNWESTLVASLLQPEVNHYEIMPWPHRIYLKKYPATQPGVGQAARDVQRIPIPKEYETELQAVITAMGDMKQPAEWLHAGTAGVGVLVSDTLMFQRFGPQSSDSHLGHFYGQALPLLMRGVPVEPVQIETAKLDSYKLLLLGYEGQKPPTPAFHDALAQWVKAGGALVVIDDDKDPFNAVREWWNSGEMHYATPRHHLFDALGLPHDAAGLHAVGKGTVIYSAKSPSKLSRTKGGADVVRELAQQALDSVKVEYHESPAFVLRRGPYVIAAGLASDRAPAVLTGRFIPLFDSAQPVVTTYTVAAGSRAVLVDLDAYPKDYAGVIAAACRVTDQAVTATEVTFTATGQADTNGVVSLLLPAAPKSVTIADVTFTPDAFEYADGVLKLRFANTADGIKLVVTR